MFVGVLQSILIFSIVSTLCILYDLMSSGLLPRSRFFGTLFDTFVHGLVGITVWSGSEYLVSPSPPAGAGEPFFVNIEAVMSSVWLTRMFLRLCGGSSLSILCGMLAGVLDFDHFLAARSFRLSDAMGLSHRPFGHAVLFVVSVCLGLYFWRPEKPWWLLVAAAWGTHHLRDATKRGLWLWPAGSTEILPYLAYIVLMGLTPFLIALWRRGSGIDGSELPGHVGAVPPFFDGSTASPPSASASAAANSENTAVDVRDL